MAEVIRACWHEGSTELSTGDMGNVEARERQTPSSPPSLPSLPHRPPRGGLADQDNQNLFSGAFDCCQSGKVLFLAHQAWEDICACETHLTRGACLDLCRRIER
jgi:hypothetical protein